MKSRLCILETMKPLKIILDSAMSSKMKNSDQKKVHFYTPKMVFIQKKTPWSLIGTKPFAIMVEFTSQPGRLNTIG